MTPRLGHLLNRTVLVSIPTLFEDGVCRSYKLLGVELHGLWLQSNDLSQRLLADNQRVLVSASPVVFVPFAQIAGVLIPTTLPTGLRFSGAQSSPAEAGARVKDTADSASRASKAGPTPKEAVGPPKKKRGR
jgi:hypothetical protein